MFLKIQNLHWVEVACQLFIVPGVIVYRKGLVLKRFCGMWMTVADGVEHLDGQVSPHGVWRGVRT